MSTTKVFYKDRCATPKHQNSDEVFNMDLDSFKSYEHDFEKQMSFIICPECYVGFLQTDGRLRKPFLGLKNLVENARKGALGYSIQTH